ncbi:MAG: sigma-E factor negative regulatory protein RseA [Pseudomonadales bacterium]|jgi:sigma-E factor negative regulatory protein RseA
MSDKLRESISALVDGEANEMDLHRVLKASETDDEVRQSWRRYQAISAVVKNDERSLLRIDISDGIRAAVANDKATSGSRISEMLKPMMSVAVAATVTVAILTGTQIYQAASGGGNASLNEIATTEDFNSSAPVTAGQFNNLALPASVSTDVYSKPSQAQLDKRAYADAVAGQRLNSYMYRHVENSSISTGSGVMPFARVENLEEK